MTKDDKQKRKEQLLREIYAELKSQTKRSRCNKYVTGDGNDEARERDPRRH